jgi:hypothetical protein
MYKSWQHKRRERSFKLKTITWRLPGKKLLNSLLKLWWIYSALWYCTSKRINVKNNIKNRSQWHRNISSELSSEWFFEVREKNPIDSPLKGWFPTAGYIRLFATRDGDFQTSLGEVGKDKELACSMLQKINITSPYLLLLPRPFHLKMEHSRKDPQHVASQTWAY